MTRLTRPLLLLCGVLLLIGPSPALAEKRGVTVGGKAPAEFFAAQTGKSWAVVIGINDYEKVRRLTYAEADAKAVADTLKERGFQVTTLYNRQATRNAILDELGDKLVERVGENDRVLIYFAGHGETKQPKGGKEMGFLLPVEAEQEGLARTAIPMSLIRDLADGLPAKQVLFVVDVCYGGIAGQQFRSLPKYTEEYLKAITRERGRQLITAGGPKQEAMEGPEWGHSVFTYYLLEGLNKGTADLNSDGIIPASELYAYLDERVFSAAQMKGHTQRPVMWTMAAEKGEFVFFASARREAPTGATTVLPGGVVASDELTKMKAELEVLKAQMNGPVKPSKPVEVAKAPAYEAPRQMEKEIIGKDGAPMVLVSEGEFLYGDTKERLPLSAFYMDKFEVTTKLYAAFLQAANRKQPDYWNQVGITSVGDRPVVGVDWHDADAYCRNYGKRLPTEQEWEKAARGTDGRKYPWGNDEPTSSYANYGKEYSDNFYINRIASIGSYEAGKSPYGIYDLAGNVYEWTSSDYNSTNSTNKVTRGGSWLFDASDLLATDRGWGSPVGRSDNRGFRCAQDVPK